VEVSKFTSHAIVTNCSGKSPKPVCAGGRNSITSNSTRWCTYTDKPRKSCWPDVPGEAPWHAIASLGICKTRTIAERAAVEKLEQLGTNSAQTFIESTSNITFKQQAEIWLKSLANRKRNPLEQTTIDNRRYALDKWMCPFFGDKLLANIHNVAMKEFVDHIAELSPATIRDYVNTAKSVVASARDREGKMLFPRAWDDEFIDVPFIEDQNQPTVDRDSMEAILREATEPYRTLYALLAGCGPMRAGEVLGLDIRSIHRLPHLGNCAEG
jgi:Phage integrase, N-terminal SAM-like domain